MQLWDELHGCVNYLNLPYDTVMNMPVHIRKYWIQRHNAKTAEENGTNTNNGESMGNISINAYAEMEQNKIKMTPH